MVKKTWLRILSVKFSNGKKSITFGENWKVGKEDLSISVNGSKYMSTLKDACTIRISNLTYGEIVTLIQGKFYDVEIQAGYRSLGATTIFKGGVLYISNSLDDTKTNTAIILCASNLVAKYGQSRINLSLNSGINLYSAIKFVCKRAGIPDSNISTQFKKEFLKNITNVNSTVGNWINSLTESNNMIISNSDSGVNGSDLLLYNAAKSNARVIKLTNNLVDLSGGFPQLTKDGLSLTISPTFNFMCGDVIEIDNSLIDVSTTNNSASGMSKGYYLDKDGLYTIYEISYNLQNRGSKFSYNLVCKSRSLISNITGGTSNG